MSSATSCVLVTGAGGGIGRSICLELAKLGLGYRIAAWDRDQVGLTKLKTDLLDVDAACKVEVYQVDISDIDQVRTAAVQVESDLGPIDCLVNNAGVVNTTPCLVKNGAIEDWMKMVNVNVVGTLNVTSSIFPLMARRKAGHVVNISSVVGISGMENHAVYSGTKHFIEGLSKSLRKEGLIDGVKVTVIRPSAVETNFGANSVDPKKAQTGDKESLEFQQKAMDELIARKQPLFLQPDTVGKVVANAINLPHEVAINEINISALGWPIV